MNIKIHREIMRRNGLRKDFMDSKTDRIFFSKKRNYNISLIPKEKRHILVILKHVT